MITYLEHNKKFAVIFTILIAIEIFVVSSIPGTVEITGELDFSWAYHFAVFFLLNFFLILSLNGKKNSGIKTLLIAPTISILYAISDEIHQIFVPLRSPAITDILIDLLGICASTLVYLYYKKHSTRKIKPKSRRNPGRR